MRQFKLEFIVINVSAQIVKINIFSLRMRSVCPAICIPVLTDIGRWHMIKQTTANKHVEMFLKLAKVALTFSLSTFLDSKSLDSSKFPCGTTVRFLIVFARENSLKFRIHVTTKTTSNEA